MKEFTFNGQRPDESVEEVCKNHPYVLLWPGVKTILLLSIPVIILIFFGASTLFSVITFVCVILAFAILSQAIYQYTSSVFIITSERVIYLEQKGFLIRKIIETSLDKIQDVSSDTKGLMKTALDFGNLMIRTAGVSEGTEIIVKNIAHPYEIQQEITKRTR